MKTPGIVRFISNFNKINKKTNPLDKSDTKLNLSHYGKYIRISAQPKDAEARTINNDIACIIDISASMDEEAMVKNEEGIKEGKGLSVLDVLKHAIRTTISNLSEKDRFALVSFSDISTVEFELQYMTKEA